MIVDFKTKENYESVFAKDGITNTVILKQKKAYFGIVFKNFPNLDISGATLENCSFENCEVIQTHATTFIRCNFEATSKINSAVTYFYGCNFLNCKTNGQFLFIKIRGEIKDCIFENISARNFGYDAGYIARIDYAKKSYRHEISGCSFDNCTVENDHGEYLTVGCNIPLLTDEQKEKMELLEKKGYNTDDFITDWGEIVGLEEFYASIDNLS